MTKRKINIKKGLTLTGKGVVYGMAAAVISICGILLPELAREEAVGKANPPQSQPFLIAAWILTIPVFIALSHALKILNYIDQDHAFSDLSIKSLNVIKICAAVFGALIALSAFSIVVIARIADPTEDVTPVVTLGFVFTLVSFVIASFVSILQKLMQSALDLKSENDLIV